MNERIAIAPPECQEEPTLEEWASEYVDSQLLPLYASELLFLDQLEDNECAWWAIATYISNRWEVPEEEQEVVTTAIERYAPKRNEL